VLNFHFFVFAPQRNGQFSSTDVLFPANHHCSCPADFLSSAKTLVDGCGASKGTGDCGIQSVVTVRQKTHVNGRALQPPSAAGVRSNTAAEIAVPQHPADSLIVGWPETGDVSPPSV